MRSVGEVAFLSSDAACPPASEMIEAMIQELVGFYGRIDGAETPSASPSDFSPPGGVFLVGFAGDEPVAAGGVKRLGPGLGEIKRMYVVPGWRGLGLARALLSALEDAAAELGHRAVRLDTGPEQPVARGLYERSGYRSISNYNKNPHASYWGEKDLG